VLGLEHPAPGRHLVLAARHRSDEALALVVRELAQIEGALWILHARTVAGRAIALVDRRAPLDLLGRRYLGPGRSAEKNYEGRYYSGNSANVHTEPPCGTRSFSRSRLMFQ